MISLSYSNYFLAFSIIFLSKSYVNYSIILIEEHFQASTEHSLLLRTAVSLYLTYTQLKTILLTAPNCWYSQ